MVRVISGLTSAWDIVSGTCGGVGDFGDRRDGDLKIMHEILIILMKNLNAATRS